MSCFGDSPYCFAAWVLESRTVTTTHKAAQKSSFVCILRWVSEIMVCPVGRQILSRRTVLLVLKAVCPPSVVVVPHRGGGLRFRSSLVFLDSHSRE